MIRVLIADDHAIIRDGVRQILADTDDITLAGEAKDGGEALRLVREQDWDLLILDISLPGRSGLELIKLIKAEKPGLPVLIFTMHDEKQYALRALRAGAAGYLTKEADGDQLVAVIRKIAERGVYVSQNMAEQIARAMMPASDVLPHRLLSDREFEVFRMIAEGKSVTDIATDLNLSVKTISTHKTHILQKMNLANQADLIRYAIHHRLIDDQQV